MIRKVTKTRKPKLIRVATPAFRVLRFNEQEREQFRTTRDKAKLTNLDHVTLSVSDKLPKLVDALAALGFVRERAKQQSMRLPICDTTLSAVREASNNTGLPSTLLLRLILTAGGKRKAK